MIDIPLSRPYFSDEELTHLKVPLQKKWVIQGDEVLNFESTIRSRCDVRYARAVSSGSAALFLALAASGIHPGDFVLTVSHSFIATANSIRACFAEPLFIDIQPHSYNLDPSQLAIFIQKNCIKTRDGLYLKNPAPFLSPHSPLQTIRSKYIGRVSACLVVHQFGFPADLTPIYQLAKKWNFRVVEDAACALGSVYQNEKGDLKPVGSPIDAATCFSFHPRKIMTTAEGGIVTTQHQSVDQVCQYLRSQSEDNSPPPQTPYTPLNYRLSDIHAAIGRAQLKQLDHMQSIRREIAETYCHHFKDLPDLTNRGWTSSGQPNWQSFPIEIEPHSGSAEAMIQHLHHLGIGCKQGIPNTHQLPTYQNSVYVLPESERASLQTVLLPIYPDLSSVQMQKIINAVKDFL